MDFFIPAPDAALALANQNIPRYSIIPDPSDTRIATSYLGTPIYDQLTLKYRTSVPFAGVAQAVQNVDAITFQTVLIEVTQTRNILKTTITGKKGGTVKEYIYDGDYYVRITGAIVSPYANLYPKDSVRQLNKLLMTEDALECESGFLGLFNIDSIVIENFTVSEQLGSRNMVPFEISACSDKPIEFQLS